MRNTIPIPLGLVACLTLCPAIALTGCNPDASTYDDHARAIDPAVNPQPPEEPPEETPMDPQAGVDAQAHHNEPDDMNNRPDGPAPTDDEIARALDAYDATIGQDKVELTDEQWRAILSDQEYYILRRSGTEARFTGRYLDNDEPGAYHCAGCGQRLYSSEHKFHSTCGWPAFNSEIAEGALTYHEDRSVGMVRTEMRCSRCDGHMGHVFDDGRHHGQELPTRHCVNGGAVIFVPEGADPQDVIRAHRAENADR